MDIKTLHTNRTLTMCWIWLCSCRCGLPKMNMMSPAHQLCTGSVSRLKPFGYLYSTNFSICVSCLGLKSVIPSSSWICRSLAVRRSSRGVVDDKQFVTVRCCDLCNLELYTLYVISKTIFNSTYSTWQYCSSIDKSHKIIQIYNVGVPWEMWPFAFGIICSNT